MNTVNWISVFVISAGYDNNVSAVGFYYRLNGYLPSRRPSFEQAHYYTALFMDNLLSCLVATVYFWFFLMILLIYFSKLVFSFSQVRTENNLIIFRRFSNQQFWFEFINRYKDSFVSTVIHFNKCFSCKNICNAFLRYFALVLKVTQKCLLKYHFFKDLI